VLEAILKQGEGFLFLTDLRITARGGHPGPALLEGLPAFVQKGVEAVGPEGVLDSLGLSGYTI